MYKLRIVRRKADNRLIHIGNSVRKAMTDDIEWDVVLNRQNVPLNIKNAEIGTEHSVTFERINQTENGGIVATVRCETIEGNTLWLRGSYGPQNGLGSLIKAADGGANIEGNSFTFSRVESDKSPVGYAYLWTA